MKKIILPLILYIILGVSLVMADSHENIDLALSDSLDINSHSTPYIGEKFIRYMYKPDKRPRNKDEWGDKKYFVLEVSTDVMENGERRAMPFTTIVRDGEEYFVAFELVTSFDTKEEALKYAEENGITDIDLTDFEVDSPDE